MAQSAAISSSFDTALGGEKAIPWYVWLPAIAVSSAMVGAHWDISWHRSIGRDTFWTPAHIAIYLCGILAAISSAYMILGTTLGKEPALGQASIRMWGFRGPLGAFILAWGGVAMLTSAPFDDWWHNAYGLDVRIISPPHTVLAFGMFSVQIGAMLLVLGRMNRAEGAAHRALERLFVYLSGMVLVNNMTFIMEYSGRTIMRSAIYYKAICFGVPFFVAAVARAGGRKWALTEIAAVYMIFWNLMNWILPLFPAEPKLGPVYYQVTHFVPSNFSVLLIVPAFFVDLLWQRSEAWNAWLRGTASAAVFLAALITVQWPFAGFLMSPAARNWFFYTNNFDYGARPSSYNMRYLFYAYEKTSAEFWTSLAVGLAAASLLFSLGIKWGNWLRRVQR
jgi:hypothetical protein